MISSTEFLLGLAGVLVVLMIVSSLGRGAATPVVVATKIPKGYGTARVIWALFLCGVLGFAIWFVIEASQYGWPPPWWQRIYRVGWFR